MGAWIESWEGAGIILSNNKTKDASDLYANRAFFVCHSHLAKPTPCVNLICRGNAVIEVHNTTGDSKVDRATILSRTVIALDGMGMNQACDLVYALAANVLTPWAFKVNDLWDQLGGQTPTVLRQACGVTYVRVLADLKLSDTPSTMASRSRVIRESGALAMTVHASCGSDSIKAALEHGPARIIGVTVLTSIDRENCFAIYGREPVEQVMVLAEQGVQSGLQSFVCSGEEVAQLRAAYPSVGLLVPGVRMPGSDLRGQKRITTPWDAFNNGATRIVLGSEVTKAKDPVAAFEHILSETENKTTF